MAINNKYLILFALLGIIFLSHLSFATTETSVQNPVKLDSLINVHSTAVFVSDSTNVKKSEYEPSSVIGFSFSLAAILSYGLFYFPALAQLFLIFNPVLLGIVGLLFSIIAIFRIRKNKRKGKKLAKAGIILTILHALGWTSLIILLMFAFRGGD